MNGIVRSYSVPVALCYKTKCPVPIEHIKNPISSGIKPNPFKFLLLEISKYTTYSLLTQELESSILTSLICFKLHPVVIAKMTSNFKCPQFLTPKTLKSLHFELNSFYWIKNRRKTNIQKYVTLKIKYVRARKIHSSDTDASFCSVPCVVSFIVYVSLAISLSTCISSTSKLVHFDSSSISS